MKLVFVARFIRKRELEGELVGDKIECVEPPAQLLEKSSQDEEERLGRFDFVFEIESLLKKFRWPNESQKAGRFSLGLVPEADGFRPEPRAELVALEGGEIAEGVDAPLVEEGDDAGNLGGAFVLHAGKLERGKTMFNRT